MVRTEPIFWKSKARARSVPRAPHIQYLQLTVARIAVGVIVEDLLNDGCVVLSVIALDHIEQVELLHRILVVVEREIPAQRGEIRRQWANRAAQ